MLHVALPLPSCLILIPNPPHPTSSHLFPPLLKCIPQAVLFLEAAEDISSQEAGEHNRLDAILNSKKYKWLRAVLAVKVLLHGPPSLACSLAPMLPLLPLQLYLAVPLPHCSSLR